jgi:hypothetical protein
MVVQEIYLKGNSNDPNSVRFLYDDGAVTFRAQSNIDGRWVDIDEDAGSSGAITYTPPGSGGVDRTVADKLSTISDFKDYGGNGDMFQPSQTASTTSGSPTVTLSGANASLVVGMTLCIVGVTPLVISAISNDTVGTDVTAGTDQVFAVNAVATYHVLQIQVKGTAATAVTWEATLKMSGGVVVTEL